MKVIDSSYNFYWSGCVVMAVLSIIFFYHEEALPFQCGQIAMGLIGLYRERIIKRATNN